MSVINNNLLLTAAAGATGYQVSRSLRFNSADSAYLSRTPASAGNRKTWTWSGWVKRTKLGSYEALFSGQNSQNYSLLWFYDDDTLTFENYNNASATTTAKFRDASAWYHIVCRVDTTNATAADRIILYVNGVRQTVTGTIPSLNLDLHLNQAVQHRISSWQYGGANLYASNSYMAEVHFIDGQAKTPSDFAETNATTGQWVPKLYSGTYGTNGFHLEFADNSAATAAALGKDSAGSNNWTPNNFSVTAGAGNDSLTDTPTSYGTDTGAGGEVRGNYATLNTLDNGGGTLSNGNLEASYPSHKTTRATFGITSGKWYWEVAPNATSLLGIATSQATLNSYLGSDAYGWGIYSNGQKYNGSGGVSYGASFTSGDIIGVALDADNGTLVFYKNGTSQGTAFTGLTSGPYFPAIGHNGMTAVMNFGQRAFAYTPPATHKALCDTNLPSPVIAKPSEVMDVKLYTGNGSTQTISGLGFSPDLVWIKQRSSTQGHALVDSVRGNDKRLFSELTSAEDSVATVSSLNSDGFGISTASGASNRTNQNLQTYAAWCWDAGSSTVTNTAGSITSSVRANASAGFSVVGWNYPSGTGASTIGHGLGVKPGMILLKSRNNATNWIIYHSSIGATKCFRFTTAAASTESDPWNNTEPTSTVFSIGAASWHGAGNIIAYCFAPVAGYSSFGSYVGNGSTDGPFVYTGFRPKYLLWKSTGSGQWFIHDTSRSPYNFSDLELAAETSGAEYSANGAGAGQRLDFLSNGFKVRTSNIANNSNGVAYIYAAFAESPFQYARAR